MNTVTFMSANFVARQVGYHMTQGWNEGDKATNEFFRPLETFEQRFAQILVEVRSMGFGVMDLWMAHLNSAWATPDHVRIAQSLLNKHQMKVSSFAGGFGATPEEFEATCRQAVTLGSKILGGNTPLLYINREFVVSTLQKYGLKLGIENHPEKTPEELLAKIGDGGNGTIGATVDTGWFATHGYDASQAIECLADHLFLVHLKDILAPGAHVTCRYGLGCVPLERCVRILQRLGYQGGISVEHEPEESDPTQDVLASAEMLKGWLKSS